MKRFYCTICKRVKRVRSLPVNTTRVHSDSPSERVGTCDKHQDTQSNQFNQSVRVRKAN